MLKILSKIIKGIKKIVCYCSCRSSCMNETKIEITKKDKDKDN